MKDVKDLDLKARWFDDMNDDDDIKVVNDMRDLSLRVLWFKILIFLRRLRMPRAKKKLMMKSEFNEKEKWLDLKFKDLLLFYVLGSAFDNLMVALGLRKLNDSKFDDAIATWCFVNINWLVSLFIWFDYSN